MITPLELKKQYEKGENITKLLRDKNGLLQNTNEIVEIAYDLQTGSYIKAMENEAKADHKREYTSEIAKTILSLCTPQTILETGVGEATTLSGVLRSLKKHVDCESFGFDLSWSRVAYAKKWLTKEGFSDVSLCTGNLLNMPFAENSIDVVYTSHSIEPNGGKETLIMKELFRVAKKYVILLEPGYELADEMARKRMDYHGYCKNLKGTAENLGYNVLEHKLFPFTANPLNPTALTIIEKNNDSVIPSYILACPKFKSELLKIGSMYYSPEALMVYPIINEIPCLRIENGIFASKYEELFVA